MKNSTATAIEPQAGSNVIFLDLPQTRKVTTAHTTKAPAKFSELPHGLPKNEEEERNNTAFLLPTDSLPELKKMFPHEWNSFRCMRYDRCGKDGGYVCHPSVNTFTKFLRAFGPKPDPTYTLDRHDPSDPEYRADGCRWACKKGQSANRRNTVYLTHSDGTHLSVAEWSRRTGLKIKTIHERIRRRWPVDRAVSPARPQKVRAINCNRSKADGMTLEEFCAQPSKPECPAVPPLLELWKNALAEDHKQPFFVVQPMHVRMIKDIATLLSKGGLDPEKVIACILKQWGGKRRGFAAYAVERGAYKAPIAPCLKYLRAHVNLAGNFYLHEKDLFEAFRKGVTGADLEQELLDDKRNERAGIAHLKSAWALQEATEDDIWRNEIVCPDSKPEPKPQHPVPMTTDLSWLKDF